MSATAEPPQQARTVRRRYPGVRSFEERDERIFFGRKRAAQELLLRVLSVRLLLQFAPSGVGKTSLLNAGLFPELRRTHNCFPFIVRLNNRAETLLQAIMRSLHDAAKLHGLKNPVIPAAPGNVWELISNSQLWSADLVLLTPVLVFDQFEEIFTLRDDAFRTEFGEQIGSLALGRPPGQQTPSIAPNPVKVIISLREEYLGRLEAFSATIPALFHERLRLPPLTTDEARDAMVEPARYEGDEWSSPQFEFHPDALAKLLDFIDGVSQTVRVIEPLTLQLVCQRAEDLARQRARGPGEPVVLTFEDFGGQAGLHTLVESYVEQVLNRLQPRDRRKARRMFYEGLLDPNGKRLMLEQGEIARDYGVSQGGLDGIVEDRLLRKEPRAESTFYEISHDRLAESITRKRGVVLPSWVKPALAVTAGVMLVAWAMVYIQAVGKEKAQAAQQETERAFGILLDDDLITRLREYGMTEALGTVLRKLQLDDAAPSLALARKLRHEGDIALEHGTCVEAKQKFEESLAVLDQLSAAGSSEPLLADRARTLGRLGTALRLLGSVDEAERSLEEAVAAWNDSAATEPAAQLEAADALADMATLHDDLGDPQRAETEFRESLRRTLALLGAEMERTPEAPFMLGRALQVYGETLWGLSGVWYDDPSTAAATLAFAREGLRVRPLSYVARASVAVAAATYGTMDSSEAESPAVLFAESMQHLRELATADPDSSVMPRERAAVQVLIAQNVVDCALSDECKGKLGPTALDEAEKEVLDSLGQFRRLAALDTDDVTRPRDVAWALRTQAKIASARSDNATALRLLDEAQTRARVLDSEQRDFKAHYTLIDVLSDRADVHERKRDFAAAMRELETMSSTAEQLPDTPRRKVLLSNVAHWRSEVMRKSGQTAKATQFQQERDALMKELGQPWSALRDAAERSNEQGIARYKEAADLDTQATESKARAITGYRAAIEHYESAVASYPFEYQYWENAREANQMAVELLDAKTQGGDMEAALRYGVRAAWMARILNRNPTSADSLWTMYEARRSLARFLHEQEDRAEESYSVYARAMIDAENYIQSAAVDLSSPSIPEDTLLLLAYTHAELGLLRWDSNLDGWQEPIRIGLRYGDRLVQEHPKRADVSIWIADFRAFLGDELRNAGDAAAANTEYELARRACNSAAARAPENSKEQIDAQKCLDTLSAVQAAGD